MTARAQGTQTPRTMSAERTPGDWGVFEGPDQRVFVGVPRIGIGAAISAQARRPRGEVLVASVTGDTYEQKKANAELIASAPKLLAELDAERAAHAGTLADFDRGQRDHAADLDAYHTLKSALNAERARSAELLAALEGIAASNGEGPSGECDEWTEAEAFHAVKRLAEAAIARARGGK